VPDLWRPPRGYNADPGAEVVLPVIAVIAFRYGFLSPNNPLQGVSPTNIKPHLRRAEHPASVNYVAGHGLPVVWRSGRHYAMMLLDAAFNC